MVVIEATPVIATTVPYISLPVAPFLLTAGPRALQHETKTVNLSHDHPVCGLSERSTLICLKQ